MLKICLISIKTGSNPFFFIKYASYIKDDKTIDPFHVLIFIAFLNSNASSKPDKIENNPVNRNILPLS